MQVVRADDVLGALGDVLPIGGQQLGADRGVEDVEQHIPQRGGIGSVGGILDHVAHQRLGYRGIDPVHRHVVPVVGGPAQRQLGEVAGATTRPFISLAISISTCVRSRACAFS